MHLSCAISLCFLTCEPVRLDSLPGHQPHQNREEPPLSVFGREELLHNKQACPRLLQVAARFSRSGPQFWPRGVAELRRPRTSNRLDLPEPNFAAARIDFGRGHSQVLLAEEAMRLGQKL